MAEPCVDPLHSYSKTVAKPAEERVNSFMHLDFHNYAKVASLSTPPKKAGINKRPRGTPTGATPRLTEKRQNLGSKWTDTEKNCMARFIKKDPPKQPISNQYWRSCATAINEELNVSRTGASCRSYFKRTFLHTMQQPECTDDESMDIGSPIPLTVDTHDISLIDSSCQTDISIPVNRLHLEDLNQEDIQNKISAVQFLKKIAKNRTSCVDDMAWSIYNNNELKQSLWKLFLCEIEESAKCMTEKRLTYPSDTSYEGLVTFEWYCVIDEMIRCQPLLTDVLLAASTTRKNINKDEHYSNILKELGLIYGILMKRRYQDLSRIQRFIAMALANEKVHQKVFDRLQSVGVTVSHCTTLKVQKQIGGKFHSELIDAIKNGKRFRIIGDNVNFKLSVSHQRQENVGHMEHWFGSAAIIQHSSFHNLSTVCPQVPILQMSPEQFIPGTTDWQLIRKDYIILVLEVLVEHMKSFQCFKTMLAKMKEMLRPTTYDTKKTNRVVPLPLLCKNEQKYADVVDILDSYEQLIEDVYKESGKPIDDLTKIHIGGDQLTRERFTGAKRLRSGALTNKERFSHLSPITFELFHLQMNFLTVFYKLLYNKDSTEIGTLHAEKIKLSRTQVNGEDVKNHYDACKELAVSLTNGYIVSAALKYFDMENVDSELPQKFEEFDDQSPSSNHNTELIENVFSVFVDEYIINSATKSLQKEILPQTKSYYQVHCQSQDGKPITLLIPALNQKITCGTRQTHSCGDGIKDYANLVLQMGMAYKCLLMNVNIPNRDRMLSCLKHLMCTLKGHNNRSKYALEILRFLANQLSLQDQKSANETFYGLFVNTKGKFDSSFGVDLQMEHIVRIIKGHIKSVHSNKTEKTLVKRTAAFSGMDRIATKFDETSNCLVRSQKHTIPTSHADELSIIAGLQRVKPFDYCEGRKLDSYPKSVQSPLNKLDLDHLKAWIQDHQSNFLYEIGQ